MMALARRAAAPALDAAAARARQHPPAGRADADASCCRSVSASPAGHADRDRRQSAPPVHRRAAGQGAVLLLPRYPGRRGRPLRRLRRAQAPRRDARARADAARPHRGGERHHGRRLKPAEDARLGAAAATAASPMRRRCRRARVSSPANGGAPITPARRSSRSRASIADGLGLKVGDTITVNVLGRNITATHRQSARGRLAKPRHQFRDGVLARHLRGAPHSISPR